MARITKPKKEKERRSNVHRVPQIALKTGDSRSDEDVATCDRCEKRVPTEEAADWMVTLGVSDDARLVIAQFCPECYPQLEWGYAVAQGGMGSLCLPIGATA